MAFFFILFSISNGFYINQIMTVCSSSVLFFQVSHFTQSTEYIEKLCLTEMYSMERFLLTVLLIQVGNMYYL